ASYGFGSVKDGSKAAKLVVVYNYQTNPVSLSESFSGPNAGDFSITPGGTCTSTLGAGSDCSLFVTFAPTAVGTESATLKVTDGPDPLGPYTVSFNSAATIPESLSVTKLNFGEVDQTASKTMIVTVTNNAATGSIAVTSLNFGGANPGDFAASIQLGDCSALGAGLKCVYTVTFTPSTETAESGTLSIAVAQDPNGGPPAVTLIGTGVTPLRVTPASINFGTVASGHSSTNRTVTVTNNGGAAVALSEGITIITGNSGDFAVTGGVTNPCPVPSGSLAGNGASCTYALKFTPSIDGAESATLGVSAAGDAASPHNVSLTGTGN
ncbi:MAG: choice-of-anchor D domain-containing protein, partial [Candidatus Binatus sp.]